MHEHHITAAPPAATYTPADLAQWAADLARIRAAARRKRLVGRPDVALELGCATLERRLSEMRRAAERGGE